MALDESQILVGLIGAIGAVLAASVPYYFIKKNEIELRIKETKLQRYDDLLKQLTVFLESPSEDLKSLAEFIMAYNRASAYASREVLEACRKYLDSLDLDKMKRHVKPHVSVISAPELRQLLNTNKQISDIFTAIRDDVNPKKASDFFRAFTIDDYKRNLLKNKNSESEIRVLYNKGVELANLGKYGEAITWYDKALEINPDDLTLLLDKGKALVESSKLEEAETLYYKVLEINPSSPSAFEGLGGVLSRLGKHEEAIECYDKALKIIPDDVETLIYKGFECYDQRKHGDATDCSDIVLKIDPDNLQALCLKGLALHDQGKPKEALFWYDKALIINPNLDMILYQKACINSKFSNKDEALTLLEKAITVNKNWKESAKTDEDFENIKDDPRFIKLIS